MTQPQLSEKVKELIQKARIVSFATWQDAYAAEVIQWFQSADDERRYLTDDDLQNLAAYKPDRSAGIAAAQMLRDRVEEIVDEARAELLTAFPTLTEPGGGLYPAFRSEACWRDFWHFLRCITYGMAAQRTDYLSDEGLHNMELLYRELNVPLVAMVKGLEGIKTASLQRIETAHETEHETAQGTSFAPYFDLLIEQLKQFTAA
jgi:Phycobilisome protein